jgi:hypothetical protein
VLETGARGPGARNIHADASVQYELSPALIAGAFFGLARDFESTLTQARLGPELHLPTLLGTRGGMSLGYAEELGWLPGRSAWLQLSVVPAWRFRVMSRLGWFMQARAPGLHGPAGHELSLWLSVEVRFTHWMWMRVNALLRGNVDGVNAPRAGTTVGAQLGVEL